MISMDGDFVEMMVFPDGVIACPTNLTTDAGTLVPTSAPASLTRDLIISPLFILYTGHCQKDEVAGHGRNTLSVTQGTRG